MTDRAKLEIEFDRRYVDLVGCFLITKIDQLITQPPKLKPGLVVQRAGTYPEALVRLAETEAELDTLPPLPPVINHFKSATYAALAPANDDIITVVSPFPPVWEHLHLYTSTAYRVIDATNPNDLIIDTAMPYVQFPDYGRNLRFYVMRGATPIISPLTPATDGEAERDYTGVAVFYLVREHYDYLTIGGVPMTVDEALDFVDARRGDAQKIVNILNQDIFSGISEELFE